MRQSCAIRELDRQVGINYIPPFRGRAIHVCDRDRAFEELPIDFAAVARYKQHEYEKLDRMAVYAETARCRQREILDYFGDGSEGECGCCDNCGGIAADIVNTTVPPDVSAATINGGAETDAVVHCIRVALSGVARARRQVPLALVVKMLAGSRSAVVAERGLDRLSTYGLLGHLTQAEVQQLLDALLAGGMLAVSPTAAVVDALDLTSSGRDVMRGVAPLTQQLPISKRLRRKIEASTSSVARATPVVVDAHSESTDVQTPDGQLPQSPGFWSWCVMQAGFTLEQCCMIRRLDESTVLDQLLESAEHGCRLEAAQILSDSERELVDRVIPKHVRFDPDHAGPHLPRSLDPRRVHLYLMTRDQANATS